MKYIVTVNDKNYEVEVEQGVAQVLSVSAAQVMVAPVGGAPAAVAAPVATSAAAPTATAAPAPAPAGAGEPLPSPMPGTIINVVKKVGDTVAPGDVVVLLEAMKMENEIVAVHAGKISQVLVSKGTVVTTGEPLVMIV